MYGVCIGVYSALSENIRPGVGACYFLSSASSGTIVFVTFVCCGHMHSRICRKDAGDTSLSLFSNIDGGTQQKCLMGVLEGSVRIIVENGCNGMSGSARVHVPDCILIVQVKNHICLCWIKVLRDFEYQYALHFFLPVQCHLVIGNSCRINTC